MVQINKIRSAKENQQPTPQICIGLLYAKKMNNLEKIDKLLEKYNLLRLNQEEIGNMSILISSNEIDKQSNKKFPTNKNIKPSASQVNSIQYFLKS